MNPTEVLRIVDAIHRDKNINKEIVFQAIEAALVSAARKHYGEELEVEFNIDREDGAIRGVCDGEVLDHEEVVGRIGAQSAKQVIIQKIREAERDALYDEYVELMSQMVSGVIQRNEGGAATVALSNVEAILPRSEQIPGETHHVNERVRATIFDVRVHRLFEQEIPEIAEGVIQVEALAREAGYRSKVAVSTSDSRVDCVGACVGVRGNRIKNIVDELSGERIDIVRYSEDNQELIPNALQPAEVEEVILCKMLGRAIVLVREDQLSLAIGRRGQNVRLASKLCGWDIEIMTREELEEQIERAVGGYSSLEGVSDELAEALVGEGFLSYDDLSIIEPDDLMQMGELSEETVDTIVAQAEQRAEEAERAVAEQRRLQKEQERSERQAAAELERVAAQAKEAGAALQEADALDDANSESEVDVSPTATDSVSEPTDTPVATKEDVPVQNNTGANTDCGSAPGELGDELSQSVPSDEADETAVNPVDSAGEDAPESPASDVSEKA